MKKHRYEWSNGATSGRVGGEEIGQLTGKDEGSEVEMQKALVLWEVLQEYKGPRTMLSSDTN